MKNYDNTISLAKFLSMYKSLYGVDLKKLTHSDVKKLFPDLKRCSLEVLDKNRALLYQGDVILVSDGHDVLPYITPEYIELEEEEFQLEGETQYDYASMDIADLKILLEKKFSTQRQKHFAKKELLDRGAVLRRKYRRCEEKRKKYEEE